VGCISPQIPKFASSKIAAAISMLAHFLNRVGVKRGVFERFPLGSVTERAKL